ncbi:MAG: M16 family metallopeptidase [Syntrophothermus sp.]
MKRAYAVYFSILLLCLFAIPGNMYAKSDKKYEEGKLYRHELKNGLKILTVERHIAPLIYHQLTYRVGSRNERLGITGISHIVEHMMFKGTKRYGKGTVSKTISDNSGIFNAFTSNDMTSYFEYLPANKIELAMDIESDRMLNSIFDENEFKPEVQVIKQERRMRTESSSKGIFQEAMNSVAYDSHPNRDPVIGWPSDLDNVTRNEAYEYYKTFYTPNNAFLVLVGDFDTEEIVKLADKYYGSIPAGKEVKEMYAVEQPQKVRKSFTLKHNDITTPSFRMSWHVPTYKDSDAAALKIAGALLCERSRDARLYKRMVEKDQIATFVAGGFGATKDPGLFNISVNVKPDSSLDRAEQIIWDEIKKLQDELISDKELQKAKNRFKFNEITNYKKNSEIGSRIANYENYYGYEVLQNHYDRALAVTKEDIQKVMKKYFNPEMVTVGYSLPKDGSKAAKNKTVKQDDEETSDQVNLTDEEKDIMPDNTFFLTNPLEIYNSIAADAKSADEIIKPKPIKPLIKEMKLKNGVKVYAVENRLTPALTFVASFDCGNIPEANEGGKPGVAGMLAEIMGRGPEGTDYNSFTERLAFVPIQVSVGGSNRGFSLQGFALNDNIDEMMKTSFDVLTKPAIRDEDITKIRSRMAIAAKNAFKQTNMQAFYYMYNQLFADHPYSKVRNTEASVNSITKEDLKNLHAKYIRPDNMTILMVGDMKPEEMKSIAEKYFGKWRNNTPEPEYQKIPAAKPLAGKEIKVFTDKDYTECTVNIGFNPFNKIDAEEQEIVDVLNNILAQSALTSRMGVELRDKQGLIYGLKSELWTTSDKIGYWKFSTKTGPKNVEKVITGIFSEIRKLIDKGITDEELLKAKNAKLGLLPFYIETPDDVASVAFELIRDKRSFDSFDHRADRFAKVTKDDVVRIAKKYFDLNKYVVVVDGPIEEHSLDHLLDKL